MNDIAGTTAGHNSKVRGDIIRSVYKAVEEIDGKIDELRQERSQLLKDRVKQDLGMKLGDFAAAYRMYHMDAEKRDTLIDTMHENFEAMGLHEQLDWVKVQERMDALPAQEPNLPEDVKRMNEIRAEAPKPKGKKKPNTVTRGAVKKPKKVKRK